MKNWRASWWRWNSTFNTSPSKLNIQKTKIMTCSPITSWQIEGEKAEAVTDFIFLGFNITMDNDCCHEIKRCLLLGWKAMTNLDSILKQRHHFADKSPYSYGFFSSHVRMWELNHKEGWAPKNWRFQIVVVEISESLLDSTENKPVSPKGNQLWILNGRTDAEAETSILWPCDGKSWLTGKDPDGGKDWRQKEKGAAEMR